MKLTKFADYDTYVAVQKATDRRKMRRLWVRESEVRIIAEYMFDGPPPLESGTRGLCHGARFGKELDLFERHIPGVEMIGTDLVDREDPRMVRWDFHDVNTEWTGWFDFVFSNSLDHAYDPDLCVQTWFGQLKTSGLLFLEWSPWHMRVRGGDCFGASLNEYVDMVNRAGHIVDLLYRKVAKADKWKCILVGKAKGNPERKGGRKR